MHPHWLEYLADPQTAEPLQLEIVTRSGDNVVEGWLRSSVAAYPIVRGVPRFAGYGDSDSYVKSFSYQWTKWSRLQFDSENVGRPLEGYTGKMWQRITERSDEDLRGAVIADFGCGPGRFIETVRARNGRVIGLDLSEAVDAAAEIFQDDPDVLICQADVLNPPLRSDSVDGAFSIGVLHHTPNPGGGCAR